MIKNIFLDAGGVILNEEKYEKACAEIITGIIKLYNKNYSPDDYWKDAEEAVQRFVPGVSDYILYKHIKNIDEFEIKKKLYKNEIKKTQIDQLQLSDGLDRFLIEFSKNFKIGILGQYGKDFKKFLSEQNLLHYFSFTEIQDDYKITKPDPRYFKAVLRNCNCVPVESVMIGDRVDKDIIPAKMIGMKTIRIRTGLHKNQEPRSPAELPDLTVNSLSEISVDAVRAMG